jgi:inosine-uridine nucleoside N-ribohydrolase
MAVLVTAMTTDIANFITSNPELAASKISRMVFMGGITHDERTERFVPEISLLAPDTSNNWTFDTEASSRLVRDIQELGIPAVFVSRHAMPTASFIDLEGIVDRVKARGSRSSVLAEITLHTQINGLHGLWDRVQMNHYNENGTINTQRHGLPERCNTDWFVKLFLNGYTPNQNEDVYQIAKQQGQGTKLYDPTAALCISESLLTHFFEPLTVEVNGIEYRIIGQSETTSNVKDSGSLKQYLLSSLETAWSK